MLILSLVPALEARAERPRNVIEDASCSMRAAPFSPDCPHRPDKLRVSTAHPARLACLRSDSAPEDCPVLRSTSPWCG
jgi:hypothetical protein